MATKTVDVSFTRPADTTTYASGDTMCNSTSAPTIMTLANMASGNGGGGIIQGITFIDSVYGATNLPEFDLYLFDTAPVMQNDNAAFAASDSEMLACVGVVRFPAALNSPAGANSVTDLDNISKSYNCAAGSTSLYAIMVARNAYAPSSGEVFKFRFHILQD